MSKKTIELRIVGKLKANYNSTDVKINYLMIDISKKEAERLIEFLNSHINK